MVTVAGGDAALMCSSPVVCWIAALATTPSVPIKTNTKLDNWGNFEDEKDDKVSKVGVVRELPDMMSASERGSWKSRQS